jgi:hypothetical protein
LKESLLNGQDKGHYAELKAFVEAVRNRTRLALERSEGMPIEFSESVITTLTTFKILESINTGMPVAINIDFET